MKNNSLQKNIPSGWQKVKFKDVAFVNQKSLGNNTEANYKFRYLDLSAVDEGRVSIPAEYTAFSNAPSRARRIFKIGDILMATVRPNLLGHYLVDFNPTEVICSTGFAVIEPKSNLLNNYFLYSYLFSKKLNDYLKNMLVGSNYPAINSTEVENLPLNLPSLPEQNRIVGALETWDRVTEKLKGKIEIKKNVKKGLMQELLTGKICLPGFKGKWQTVRLGDVSKMSSGGTPKSSVSDYYDGNIPWVSIADMTQNGKYIYGTVKKLSKLGLENSSAKIYPKGTILYAMYASIGECSIAGVEMASSQAILGIRPVEDKLNPLFLYYYLNLIKEKIKLQGQQGTQSNLNAGMVRKFKFKLPDIKEQEEIANVLTAADDEILKLENKLTIFTEQKRFLLNNLITGTIRVPEKTGERIGVKC